ncbi:MAG: helix-turn-helix domain-containing protein [Chloroflexi bacterium]|nr:helix-turn-helix domain-containing protein [Chloroflexota bacterium]
MAEYVAVAVAGRDPAEVAAALNGGMPGKVTGVRRRTATLIVLFEPHEGATRTALAEAVRATAARSRGDAPVSVGAAGPRKGPAGAQTAMLEAEHALAVGRALNGDGLTTHFEDLGPYCFVLGRPLSEIREFCERVLGPLATDPDRYDELSRTLEEYLNAHGSLNEVARRLFLHRNTVRQRLRRIAEITRADLANADARLALHLAMLGRRALDQLEAGAA